MLPTRHRPKPSASPWRTGRQGPPVPLRTTTSRLVVGGDDCIAVAVRESVQQLDVRVEVHQHCFPEAKHQWRPSHPVLAHHRPDDREQAAPHTRPAPRAEHGSNSQGLPCHPEAIPKAGVRRPDTERMLRHASDRQHSQTCFRVATRLLDQSSAAPLGAELASGGRGRPSGGIIGR